MASNGHYDNEESHPKVSYTPPSGLIEEAKQALLPYRELLVEDEDPFHGFRGKSAFQKAWIAIGWFFPIINWLSKYKKEYIFGDVVAGLTITSLAVPQDLAYAKLANLPPVNGLYSSFLPPLVYGFMGSSMHLAIGPVAVVSLLLGNLLKEEYKPFLDKEKTVSNPDYFDLAITTTFFAGLIQLGMGLLRLGFVVDFLSHAVVIGFMAGAAITIALQQLKSILGYVDFTTNTDVVSVLKSIFEYTEQFEWRPFVIGLSFLIYLTVLKYSAIYTKNKKFGRFFFFLQALGPLTCVVISTFFTYIAFKTEKEAKKKGVRVVGHIKKGINPSSLDNIKLSGEIATKAIKAAFVAGLVAITEAVAIGRTFAALKGYHIDGNQEMVALGTGNIFGSFSSSYIATGSFSRSAVNYTSGAVTPVTQFVMSSVILLTLLVITPLFKFIPNAVLSAIIISAVLGLIDIQGIIQIFKTDKIDFVALLGAFFGVLFISIEFGLLIAVSLSIVRLLVNVTRPHTAVLGKISNSSVYRSVAQYDNAITHPGLLIIRIDSPIYFANANYIREKILRFSERYTDNADLQYVILELTPVSDIDTSGIHALEELHTSLKKSDITLGVSNPSKTVLWKFHTSGFVDKIGQEWIFLTINEAVKICSSLVGKAKGESV